MNGDFQPAQIINTLDPTGLLYLLLIVGLALLLILAVQQALPWLGNRLHGKRRLYLLAMVPLLRLLIIVGAFLSMVPIVIEPSLQNMVTLLGAAGLALGFALKDYVSSLIAGVVAVGEAPYRNGDWISIGEVYGEVKHVGMRTVQVLTPDDTLVSIPHLRLWSEAVYNASGGSPRLQCVADFYLHPHHDAARVQAVLADVALASAYLQVDAPIAVVVQEKPWGTHYRLKAYPMDARQQFRFVSDLTVRGRAALDALGVAPAAVAVSPPG